MAFRTYQNLGEFAKAHNLKLTITTDRLPVVAMVAPEIFKEELTLTLQKLPFNISEAAICENLIYPILREVWKQFRDTFMVWSHQPISLNSELNGVPDYLFTRQSPLGSTILDSPYVAVVEAKRDDFTLGWAQCAIEMYTIQQLNQDTRPVFGIVSNGRLWEFADLTDTTITYYVEGLTIREVDEIFGALTHVLETCKRIYNL